MGSRRRTSRNAARALGPCSSPESTCAKLRRQRRGGPWGPDVRSRSRRPARVPQGLQPSPRLAVRPRTQDRVGGRIACEPLPHRCATRAGVGGSVRSCCSPASWRHAYSSGPRRLDELPAVRRESARSGLHPKSSSGANDSAYKSRAGRSRPVNRRAEIDAVRVEAPECPTGAARSAQIDERHRRVDLTSGTRDGPRDDQRDPEGRVVHEHAVRDLAVLAEGLPWSAVTATSVEGLTSPGASSTRRICRSASATSSS